MAHMFVFCVLWIMDHLYSAMKVCHEGGRKMERKQLKGNCIVYSGILITISLKIIQRDLEQ